MFIISRLVVITFIVCYHHCMYGDNKCMALCLHRAVFSNIYTLECLLHLPQSKNIRGFNSCKCICLLNYKNKLFFN